ncbi:hypothetical protein [Mycolicibacterium aubagnense]|uniref:Secreted protein n=1 Tax=Mycolicibacterium aubagnense TaxID=319707 RepID=A0ABN5Z0W0_9MYCO|nr:hypothetical protein [Mycolicibacterium aubagnense]TLH67363.1 hypothetical protein C1S80_06010 [Mycolicibacterium aubagnense]WGI31780.1 hypothetical protein QDT91_21545 [Mycolicibacterium aubagnense]BBX86729.1 hypothetical protein MAUB_46020 [Mycolicibacterium aubagnense]
MNRRIAALAAAMLATCGMAPAAPAEAGPLPPHTWCPGDNMTYSRYDMSSGPGIAYQWDMNVCHTWYFVKGSLGNVPYQGHLPSGVWDGDNPPDVRQDSCDFCS